MFYIIISIILNTLLGVIFRFMGQFRIHNATAIVVNYFVCFIVGAIMSKGRVLDPSSVHADWIPVLLFLGVLFIITFNAVAATVQAYSVTIAALVQKMSVVLVVLFSLFYFREQLDGIRALGLTAGFASIFLITGKPSPSVLANKPGYFILLPLAVFLLAGCIDSTFVYVNRVLSTDGHEEIFGSYLFLAAGVLGALPLLYSILIKGHRISKKDILAGVILGVPNYFSIYYVQRMLTTGIDGSVIYPIHNIGILLLSAVVSKLLFDEHFRWIKYIGMGLAIISIILLALAPE